MEDQGHSLLKSGSGTFKAKRNDTIRKISLWSIKKGFVLMLFVDLDLVIMRKNANEGKEFMTSTCIYDLVSRRSGEFVFGTSQIQITEVSAHKNGSFIFINGNMIGNPSGIRDGYINLALYSFSISSLMIGAFDGWMGRCFWQTRETSDHVSMRCSIIEGVGR